MKLSHDKDSPGRGSLQDHLSAMHLLKFELVSAFFTVEALQRSTQHCYHGPMRSRPSSSLCPHLLLADHFQVQSGRSKMDDLLQSCEINSGELGRHFQSLKHLPWPSQRQSFMLTKQLGSVKALLVVRRGLLLEHGRVSFHPCFWPSSQLSNDCQNVLSRWLSGLQLAGHMHPFRWLAHPPHLWPKRAQTQLWRLV